jgi:ferredoxin/flavodoxin
MTPIYYFSGSGNSLAVARSIAEKTRGTVNAIARQTGEDHIRLAGDSIGLVFPVYHASYGESGIPFIVQRFISRITHLKDTYVFAVCTHSGAPGDTIGNLRELVQARGGELSLGIAVALTVPFSVGQKLRHVLFHTPLSADEAKAAQTRQRLYGACEEALSEAAATINARASGSIDVPTGAARFAQGLSALLGRGAARQRFRKLSGIETDDFEELTKRADASFSVSKACSSCGICARVCPVANIELVDGKPSWRGTCENCYACYQWCPEGAIGGAIVEFEKRHHHPDVRVSDFLMRG